MHVISVTFVTPYLLRSPLRVEAPPSIDVTLAEITVEGRGMRKHAIHVCDHSNVPLAEVTVERLGTTQTWL